MKISPARLAAFEILLKIETDKSFSSILLPIYEEKLEAKDRALCHALTLGTLRKQIYLDAAIDKFVGKKLDSAIRVILRIGLFQLLFTDKIPAHAAINESVNLAVKAKKTSAKHLVNAVLRRATREKIELEFTNETEKIAVETSHPRWLIERWIEQFGLAETAKLAAANNETPEMVFRLTAKSDENTLSILKKCGLEIVELEIVKDAWKVSGANEMLRLYAAEGKIYFQDEASQIVAQSVDLKAGESFLDVCAAPGSKATYIGKEWRVESGEWEVKTNSSLSTLDSRLSALFVAGDLHSWRVETLRENCRRQGADFIRVVRYDAENALPFADETFDVVLVDAPCSGTGTIRHNPEIRYFLRESDFKELSDKQLRILENASKTVKRGGRLIYSTCSLEREENEAVVEKFLARNEQFYKAAPKIPALFNTGEKFARTFPQRDKTDGFFIAEIVRK
ncbi:MAG: 16S rRNA (cytosine(967)-C(5))-methyltransferase RsmB [Pyrinomonadaceae bacterium]